MRKNDIIINGLVGYNKCKGIIYNLADPNTAVTLQNPANQCLAILLEKQPEIVNQDYLFHHVWEKNGLPTNANTLYQSISLIRKAFKAAGIEENIIKTVPRLGLTIPEYVHTQTVTEEDEKANQPSNIAAETSPDTAKAQQQNNDSTLPFDTPFTETLSQQTVLTEPCQSLHIQHYIIGLLLFILAAIAAYWGFGRVQSNVFHEFSFYSSYKNCQIYILNNHKPLDHIERTISKMNIPCEKPSTIYYSNVRNSYRESLIQCKNGNCISYYYFDARKDIHEN